MLPELRQTMMFSARCPRYDRDAARGSCATPMTIHAGHIGRDRPVAADQQVVYRTHSLNKREIVERIMQANGRGPHDDL